ncbi:hypothetical protein C8J56DRAFT_1059878 [Mycena floridula]|nr:hypothetical protein C8J56DRAFT_1059878 [Mycena floridula]
MAPAPQDDDSSSEMEFTKDQLYHQRHHEERRAAVREYYQSMLKNQRKEKREQRACEESSECILHPSLEASVAVLEQDVADWRGWFGRGEFGGGVDWSTLGDKVTIEERDEHEAAGAVLRRRLIHVFQNSNFEDVERAEICSLFKRCVRLNTNLVNGTMVLRG